MIKEFENSPSKRSVSFVVVGKRFYAVIRIRYSNLHSQDTLMLVRAR